MESGLSSNSKSLSLTPMEEQIMGLFAMKSFREWLSEFPGSNSSELQTVGSKVYGQGWGGSSVKSSTGAHHYPTILRFLGRLAKKGLVERYDQDAQYTEGSWGNWQLTDQGRELLGLDPE